MGALEAVRGNCSWRTRQTTPDRWKNPCGRACFIVTVGLESPPCLIGMDIMRPLRVHIDVAHGTATPAQPDPQTVHLNTAQSRQQPSPKTGLPSMEAACPPQNPQQRKKMPLPGTDFAAVDTARPPPTQPQRMKMPLLEVDSPAVRAASPPEFSQQRMKMPLPEIEPSTMGAAYSSYSQLQ